MKCYALALDLVDDKELISEYERWHRPEKAWPEVRDSIVDSGILSMRIYRTGNRLFMMIETEDLFSFERKAGMDAANTKVQEWEELMWKYQKPLPWADKDEKWVMMDLIYALDVSKIDAQVS